MDMKRTIMPTRRFGWSTLARHANPRIAGLLGILLVSCLLVGTRQASAEEAASITMREFAFEGVPARLQPGTYTWNIANRGQEPHVLSLAELLPGKTLEDVVNALATSSGSREEGPPKGLFVGDDQMVGAFAEAGKSRTLEFTLRPGNYVAVCPLPDPASGKLHANLGMIELIRVRVDAPAALPNTGAPGSFPNEGHLMYINHWPEIVRALSGSG